MASGGGPAVVRQMLQGWPMEELGWWSVFRDSSLPGESIAGFRANVSPGKLYPVRKIPRLKSWLMEHLWSKVAAKSLRQAIENFRPDCVWAIPHNWAIPPLRRAMQGSSVPFHTTVQDFVDVHENPRRFGATRCNALAAMADSIYAASRTRDATSYPMLEELERRTGAKGEQMLHQGLEAIDFDFLDSSISASSDGTLRIGYAGTILVMDEFRLFVQALEVVRAGTGMEIHLEFFGAHSYRSHSWFDPSWMLENGNLGDRAVIEALRLLDWGFVPMSLTDDDPRYNRFSFPTKFITYLAAGLPVITLGHPDSSVVRFARGARVGLNYVASDVHELAKALAAEFERPRAKAHYRGAIVRCARQHFDAEKMRSRLWSCFSSATPAARGPQYSGSPD